MCLLFPSGLINTSIPHNQDHAQRIFGGTLVVYIVERENFREDTLPPWTLQAAFLLEVENLMFFLAGSGLLLSPLCVREDRLIGPAAPPVFL